MTAPLVDVDFETWFSEEIGCDGVIALHIPPHDAPAKWTVARRHSCTRDIKTNKCDECYRRLMAHLNEIMNTHAAIGCAFCNRLFFDLDSFVVYRRL